MNNPFKPEKSKEKPVAPVRIVKQQKPRVRRWLG
jgi:hypothetical protein